MNIIAQKTPKFNFPSSVTTEYLESQKAFVLGKQIKGKRNAKRVCDKSGHVLGAKGKPWANPDHWMTYDDALTLKEKVGADYIMLVQRALPFDFAVFDVDGKDFQNGTIFKPDNGLVEPLKNFVDTIGTRSSLSARKNGIHIYFLSPNPKGSGHWMHLTLNGIEGSLYTDWVVTYNKYDLNDLPIVDLSDLVYRAYQLQVKSKRVRSNLKPLNKSDDEVLVSLPQKFKELYHTRGSADYRSPSEADFALLSGLMIQTRGNEDQSARIFERSVRYRPEKGEGYITRSLRNISFIETPASRIVHQCEEWIERNKKLFRGRKGLKLLKCYKYHIEVVSRTGKTEYDLANSEMGRAVGVSRKYASRLNGTLKQMGLITLVGQSDFEQFGNGTNIFSLNDPEKRQPVENVYSERDAEQEQRKKEIEEIPMLQFKTCEGGFRIVRQPDF